MPHIESSAPLIVVGIDGSDSSETVLSWARDQAMVTGSGLRVVFGWHVDDLTRELPMRVGASLDRAARARVAAVVASVAADVDSEQVVEEAAPVELLLREAKGADLLVLGSVGHRGTGSQREGSVLSACLRRAPCPVVVVPVEP